MITIKVHENISLIFLTRIFKFILTNYRKLQEHADQLGKVHVAYFLLHS